MPALILPIAFVLSVAASSVPGADLREESANTMNTVAGLFHPFWSSTTQDRETLFFHQRKEGVPAWAPLLFPPDKIVSVRASNGSAVYEEGRDFVVDAERCSLRLTTESRIPFKTVAEMYPSAAGVARKIAQKRGAPDTLLLFSEGRFFHDLQVDVTYTHAPDLWTGCAPKYEGASLPRLTAKLKAKQPITLCAVGDSITAGYNSSKLVQAPPDQPSYAELVALGIEHACGCKVAFTNYAVAGWTSATGLGAIDRLTTRDRLKPDLVIIAFGMNDASGGNVEKFIANTRGIMDAVRAVAPEAEFVLVAPMLPNAEWHAPKMESFPRFRDALAGLSGQGAALADMTTIWTDLLKRKSFHDLTGNGLNHPNDFGHRIYAQVILTMLVPPTSDAGKK